MPYGEQFNIEIDPPEDPWDSGVNPDQWIRSTEAALAKVASVATGKALLRAILAAQFWIKIQPLLFGVCNAHGGFYSGTFKNRTYKGVVKFEASVFSEGSHCFRIKKKKKFDRGGRPDEVLFHELIHAFRQGLGLGVSQPTLLRGGLWRYNHEEEFYAVVLANIYISDITNRGSGLRAGQRGHLPLEGKFSTSTSFFASSTQILPLLKKFKEQHHDLWKELAKVKAEFNPIRAIEEQPEMVERISNWRRTVAYEKNAERIQKAQDTKRLNELNKAGANERAKIAKRIAEIQSMTPQQIAEKMGSLAREVVGTLKDIMD